MIQIIAAQGKGKKCRICLRFLKIQQALYIFAILPTVKNSQW